MSVALVIQYAMRMRRILLSVTSPPLPYFSTSSHKQHDYRKKNLLNIKSALWISLHVSKTFLILSRTERYKHKRTYVYMQSTRHSCQILKKLEFSVRNFEKKNSSFKLCENLSIGGRVVLCGQMDGRTEGHTDRQTWWKWWLLFAISWKRVNSSNVIP